MCFKRCKHAIFVSTYHLIVVIGLMLLPRSEKHALYCYMAAHFSQWTYSFQKTSGEGYFCDFYGPALWLGPKSQPGRPQSQPSRPTFDPYEHTWVSNRSIWGSNKSILGSNGPIRSSNGPTESSNRAHSELRWAIWSSNGATWRSHGPNSWLKWANLGQAWANGGADGRIEGSNEWTEDGKKGLKLANQGLKQSKWVSWGLKWSKRDLNMANGKWLVGQF